ncbi:MAG: hypothetical protein Q9219_002375 [cf. Caloplaca sp. 3 TL-2023]
MRPGLNPTYTEFKRGEIHDMLTTAFDGRIYISRLDLDEFTSRATINKIVVDDISLDMDEEEKNIFVDRIFNHGRTLFAMCLHAELQMDCLKTLLDRSIDDGMGKLLTNEDLCHHRCRVRFCNLVNSQGSFRAAEFNEEGQYLEFPSQIVVPLHYHGYEEDEDDLRHEDPSSEASPVKGPATISNKLREKSRCGTGSYCDVYRITIDPGHHTLDRDLYKDFAVKEFYQDRPRQKELRMLDKLRHRRYGHIVTHLVSWTQNDRFYMLFPYAQCNLRLYMQRWTYGDPDVDKNRWFLSQLGGMADALWTIHTMFDNELSNLEPPSRETPVRESGWRHDLHPDNILFFLDYCCIDPYSRVPGCGTFCIADFGAGMIHRSPSTTTQMEPANETLSYEPPERVLEGKTSRPYDIWSLGCVFLEMVLWAVLGSDAVRKFRHDRLGRRNLTSRVGFVPDDHAFWHVNEKDEVVVRSAVLTQISELKKAVVDQNRWGPFEAVLEVIEKMLDPNRLTRISALQLFTVLKDLHTRTWVDDMRSRDDVSDMSVSSMLRGISERRTPGPN